MAESQAILSGSSLPADLGEIADAAPLRLFLRRFRRHRLAVGAVVVLLLLIASALLAPLLSGYDPTDIDLALMRQPPSVQHWLGTDLNGRDVLSRLLHAGRVSLSVGVVAVSISTVIGMALGGMAGYLAGRVDTLIMRVTDVFMAFPTLIIVITLVSFVGPSIYNIMLALGVFGWPATCRLVRAQVLVLRGQEFTQAARALGASHWRVVGRHMLPNALSPVVVSATFGVANAILTEAGLSFLGLGVQPPTPSWGNMLQSARGLTELESMPWLWVPPGLMVMLAVLSINFIGDGLRDALDPRSSSLGIGRQ